MAEPTPLEKVLKDAGLDSAAVLKVAKAVEPVIAKATEEAACKAAADAEAAMQDKLDEEKKKKDEMDGSAPVQKEDGSWDFSRVPEAARATVQAIWKEKTESAAALAKVQKSLDEERDVRITKEFNDKAAGFKHLGVSSEDLGRVLKETSAKAPEAFKLLDPILKSLDEKIAKGGLFKEIGSAAGNGAGANARPGETNAEAQINAIAKSYVEKDAGKMTREAAISKAWAANPHLYNEHRAEVEARKRA